MQSTFSSRRPRFEFLELNSILVQQLTNQSQDHFSAVLLGPRGIGKQQLITDVLHRLPAVSNRCTVRLRCDAVPRVGAEARLLHGVISQLKTRFPNANANVDGFRDLEPVFRQVLENPDSQLTIVASNLDSLPTSLARDLLILFRSLRSHETSLKGQLSVLITGSADLVSLVYGADSEFTPDRQIVLSGCAPQYFQAAAGTGFGSILGDLSKELWQNLHSYTGGSLLLLQILMAALFDMRRRSHMAINSPMTQMELDGVTEQLDQGHHTILDALMPAFARAENSIESLTLLRTMLESERAELTPRPDQPSWLQQSPPTDVELCGVARRAGRNEVTWHSPLMKSAARHYFSQRVLGDAFACVNDWENAVNCYRQAESDGEPWVFAAANRPRLSAAQRAFEARLHQLVTEPQATPDDVIQLFGQAGQFVLGFDAVYCFSRTTENSVWQCDSLSEKLPVPSTLLATRLLTLLPHGSILRPQPLPVPERADEPFICMIGLPRSNDFPERVLLLSSFESKSPLTQARRLQTTPVTTAFCSAIERACQLAAQRTDAQHQKHLLDALPAIFQLSSSGAHNVRDALRHAGEQLRRNGYRRVMFSLVDEKSRRIRGVEDVCDEGLPSLAEITDYKIPEIDNLHPEYDDIQQECVHRGVTICIPDASVAQRTNKTAVVLGNLRALVLLPIPAGETGRVIGTMHIERNDRELPSEHQLRTLEYFAAQLGKSLDSAAAIDLLIKAINDDPDATLLIDNRGRVAYLNRQMQQSISPQFRTAGWIGERDRPAVAELLPEDVLNAVKIAKGSDGPISRFTEPVAGRRRVATALKLKDWKYTDAGVVLRLQDIQRTYLLFESVREITAAASEDAVVNAMLDSLKKLGHTWARLYLHDSVQHRLQAWAQFGFDPRLDPDGYNEFKNHSFFLKSPQESPSSWLCFKKGTPLVLQLDTAAAAEKTGVTSDGLQFLRVDDSGCDRPYLQKKPGDKWIELPLHSPEKNQIYGKITANVPEQMSLYDVEHLKILAEACSAAFSAIRELDRRQMVFDALRRSDRNQAIIDFRHGLVSDLRSVQAGIKNAINRPIERKNKKLEQLLLRMERIIGQRTQTLLNMTAQQAPIIEPQDLRKLIEESIISPGFNALHISTSTADCSFIVNCNKDQMQVAFSELLENSRLANEANDVDRNNTSIQLVLSHIKEGGTRFVQIDYMDNGCGVQPRNLTKIFSRNCSFWPPKLYRLGGGNGLSVVATAVTDAGGRIWAEPRTGGVHFVIQIPATE